MLPRTLLICILDLIAVRAAFGWNHISKSQFQSSLAKDDLALVAFVHPQTETSQSLEAEWLSATSETSRRLLSIDCAVEGELCAEHDVQSFPAIRLLQGSKTIMRYKGPRKASEIIPFLHRATSPIVSHVSRENITAFISSDESVFVAYISSEDDHLSNIYTTLASKYRSQYSFGLSTSSRLAQSAGLSAPSIVCIRPNEGEQEVLPGESRLDQIEKFIEKATTPIIGQFTRRNEMKYMKAGKSLVYFFSPLPTERETYATALKPIAKKYKEYLNFVTVDVVEYGHMLPSLGHSKTDVPVVSVFNPTYGQVFPFSKKKRGEITAESVENFVLDIVQGKVLPGVNGGGDGEGEKGGVVHDEV